jgi:hypothetical protein
MTSQVQESSYSSVGDHRVGFGLMRDEEMGTQLGSWWQSRRGMNVVRIEALTGREGLEKSVK